MPEGDRERKLPFLTWGMSLPVDKALGAIQEGASRPWAVPQIAHFVADCAGLRPVAEFTEVQNGRQIA